MPISPNAYQQGISSTQIQGALATDIPALYAAATAAGTPANPTAVVGLSAVNGSAATTMRSDAAPPLDVSIAPTWTAAHTFSAGLNTNGLAVRGGLPIIQIGVNYSVQAADIGKGIYVTVTGKTITIPTGLPAGAIVTIMNGGGTSTTIANGGTMYLAGVGTTGSRTLAAFGKCTVTMAFGTDIWLIDGTGLT